MGMFTKPLSGKSYAVALLIRAGVILAVFAVAFTLFGLSMGDCSANAGQCGAGLALVFLATLTASATFLLSIVGISIRRARDAGWHPLIGLLPVLLPFALYTPLQGILLLTGPLFLLFTPLPFPPLSMAWLATIAVFCFTPRGMARRLELASNRPPRI
tara:strand:- start:2725 stop:3198 length:474 start_codon:yes stop_codon:yes gene_type:complete